MYRKKNFFLFILLILNTIYIIHYISPAYALTMINDDFVIQAGNLDSFAGKSTSGNYKLGITGGENVPGLFTGTNFKVRLGFQYVHSIIRFKFAISGNNVDFGPISPTNPLIRTQTLTVTNGSAYGYNVTAIENHPLQTIANNTIPDTSCDNGTCNQKISSIWNSVLTYGFGYRCDNVSGFDCATGFTNPNSYKPFANLTLGQVPTAVMTGTTAGKNKKATITYKLNISATQPGGAYNNQITYVATPTF